RLRTVSLLRLSPATEHLLHRRRVHWRPPMRRTTGLAPLTAGRADAAPQSAAPWWSRPCLPWGSHGEPWPAAESFGLFHGISDDKNHRACGRKPLEAGGVRCDPGPLARSPPTELAPDGLGLHRQQGQGQALVDHVAWRMRPEW